MARDDDPTEDFGRILESFERDREVQGAERPRGRLIRTEPTARPPEARPHIEVDDEDFATALAEFESGAPSVPAPRRVGAVVEGQVASIDLERALVDLGGKAEGSLATAELLDDEGVLRFEVGSTVRVEIVAEASSGPRLRLLGAGGRSAATAGARASVLE
ncbi:MAG: S1 RNA-binding domain-containing protein, partial [Acidobacteriota bacterium]